MLLDDFPTFNPYTDSVPSNLYLLNHTLWCHLANKFKLSYANRKPYNFPRLE